MCEHHTNKRNSQHFVRIIDADNSIHNLLEGCTESCPNILQFAENPGAPGGFPPWPPTEALPLDPGGGLHSPHTPGMCAGNKVTCYENFVTPYQKN